MKTQKKVSKTKESQVSKVTLLDKISNESLRSDIPKFRVGDTLKVHAKVIEGSKERIQIFEGVVLKRTSGSLPGATFTVRKISYNIGVERTFLLHSPRIDKIEVATRGAVRRARLFYLRPLRGKAARIKSRYNAVVSSVNVDSTAGESTRAEAVAE